MNNIEFKAFIATVMIMFIATAVMVEILGLKLTILISCLTAAIIIVHQRYVLKMSWETILLGR
jgi:hypothetical protein